MNSKTLWAVIIIVILAAIGYWYVTSTSSPAMESGQATTTSQSGANSFASDPVMVGTWKSTTDANYSRTFTADGHVTDAYVGEPSATQTGTYLTIDPATEAGIPVPAANLAGMTVIKIVWPDGPMYFSINSMTDTTLTMTYLGGTGQPLTFTKVQ